MLLSETTTIKWNAKIKKHYVDLGYTFTKMKDPFEVKVCDLTNGSSAMINIKCDYCGKEYYQHYYVYLNSHRTIDKDCCSNLDCLEAKSKEALNQKYGTSIIRHIDGVSEKVKETNLKRYGCENPFANEDVKKKIRETNLEKYGVEYTMQNPNVVKKGQETCIRKYGVSNYGKIYSETHKGELSSSWKGGVSYHRAERSTNEYREWRKSVFARDFYTCQCCGAKNGNGVYVRLEAHHIFDWVNHEEKRYDINNGSTLCQKCHILFHSLFGKKENTLSQYNEFIDTYKENIDKKVC